MTSSKQQLVDKITEIWQSNNQDIKQLGGLIGLSEDLLVTILKSYERIRHELFPEYLDKYWREKEEENKEESL